MPGLSKDFKQAIAEIPVRDLRKLVMQAAAKHREFYDIINIQYVSGDQAEKEIFEEIKDKALAELCFVEDRGVLQKNLAKAISKAVKHINHYVKVTRNKLEKQSCCSVCWMKYSKIILMNSGRAGLLMIRNWL